MLLRLLSSSRTLSDFCKLPTCLEPPGICDFALRRLSPNAPYKSTQFCAATAAVLKQCCGNYKRLTDVCTVKVVGQGSPYVNQKLFDVMFPLVQDSFCKVAGVNPNLYPYSGFLGLQKCCQLSSCIKRKQDLFANTFTKAGNNLLSGRAGQCRWCGHSSAWCQCPCCQHHRSADAKAKEHRFCCHRRREACLVNHTGLERCAAAARFR